MSPFFVGVTEWTRGWNDLKQVLVTRNSVFFVPRTGGGARFVTMRSSVVKDVTALAQRMGVIVTRVRTTFPQTWSI